MKFLKKYEAKRYIKNKVNPYLNIEEEWIEFESLQEISFDSFFDWFPFNSLHYGIKYNSYTFAPKNKHGHGTEPISNKLGHIYLTCKDDLIDIPDELVGNMDWYKRNIIIAISVCTGGVAGGSCWEDSDPQEYYINVSISMDDFKGYLKNVLPTILDKYAYIRTIDEIVESLTPKIANDYYTDYEYYGNQDDYTAYYIKLWDLYKILSLNGDLS